MSYILDALRRADSERERGAVPSLHAKQLPETLADEDEDERGGRAQPLLWAVIGLSLVLAAVLAWQFMGSSSPEPVIPPVAVAPAAAPVMAPAVVAPLAPPPQLPPPTPNPVAVAPKAPVAAPPAERKPPPRAAAKLPAPASASAAEPVRPAMAFNELPEQIRRELPQLVIGGAMYSQTPANRMLILNGQVFHEGDKVTGGLVLEQISLKSAVLAYKGYRYNINY